GRRSLHLRLSSRPWVRSCREFERKCGESQVPGPSIPPQKDPRRPFDKPSGEIPRHISWPLIPDKSSRRLESATGSEPAPVRQECKSAIEGELSMLTPKGEF